MSRSGWRDDGEHEQENVVEKRPRAIRDLADIAVYLAEESRSSQRAFRFLDAAEASFRELAAMPEMGATREYRDPSLTGMRMWHVSGFHSHLIFYRRTKDGIEIIRVVHAKRDIETMFGRED